MYTLAENGKATWVSSIAPYKSTAMKISGTLAHLLHVADILQKIFCLERDGSAGVLKEDGSANSCTNEHQAYCPAPSHEGSRPVRLKL